LQYAIRKGDLSTVVKCIETYPHTLLLADSQTGMMTIHVAAARGHLKILSYLLDQGVDINIGKVV